KAMETGKFKDEIVPVEIPQRKGNSVLVDEDEAPRKDTTIDKLSSLRSAFGIEGSITAGKVLGVNDGDCAFVVMSDERARELNQNMLATIIGHTEVAVEAKDSPKTPGLIINKLLEKTEKTKEDIDLFEINEAFSVVSLASIEIAGIDPEKVNVNG